MKYVLFSDIHANLEALDSVLAAAEKEKPDQLVCLGDIVGYGADPAECIARIRDLQETKGCKVIAGNHDYAACGKSSYRGYNHLAREAIKWTMSVLSPADKKFLSKLPLTFSDQNIFGVHSSPIEPEQWHYILDIDDAYLNFQAFEARLCFIGHSHRPVIFYRNGHIDWEIKDTLSLDPASRYIINIGSVGQPRDGNPAAAYALFDTGRQVVEIKRVEYDLAAAQSKIRAAGLPDVLAERLAFGK